MWESVVMGNIAPSPTGMPATYVLLPSLVKLIQPTSVGTSASQAHEPHRNLFMLPVENIGNEEPFLRNACDAFYIKEFASQKRLTVMDIEHGLNLDKGQYSTNVCF